MNVKIVYDGNNEVYKRHHQLFTDYSFVEGREAYISKDNKFAIAKCENRWMIQRSHNL